MQTNASIVRNVLVSVAALTLVACGGATPTPSGGGSGNGTGTGGNGTGSGGTVGSGNGSGGGAVGTGGGGSGGTTGGGGGTTGGGGGTTGGGGGGGTTGGGGTGGGGGGGGGTTMTIGCASYVACLNAAMSATDAMACDSKLSTGGQTLIGAVDDCVAGYCEGSGGTARCKKDANGAPVNLDGSAPFDATTGAPSGDCGNCLVDGEIPLFGGTCTPTGDPACSETACSQQISACQADKS